jgi:hypothetical protein
LITGTGTAQAYTLHNTDQGSVLTWGSSQILIMECPRMTWASLTS